MNHKKIAELAHVSPSTVSKALSGSSEINRETAEKYVRLQLTSDTSKKRTNANVTTATTAP